MDIYKNKTSVGKIVEKFKFFYTVDGKLKWYRSHEKVMRLLKKITTELSYNPITLLLGLYLNN
jgi:hypothetical protein